MTREHSILCCCALLLVLTTLVSPIAYAGTGVCMNTHADCTYQCPTDGSTCYLYLQRVSDGHGGWTVTMTAGGSPVTILCAKPGTPFEWRLIDADATSFADIRFDQVNYPFQESSIQADSVNKADTTLNTSLSHSCYQFAITDCQWSAGGACGYADPKVVMNPPGGGFPKGHHHDHDKDKGHDKDQD